MNKIVHREIVSIDVIEETVVFKGPDDDDDGTHKDVSLNGDDVQTSILEYPVQCFQFRWRLFFRK